MHRMINLHLQIIKFFRQEIKKKHSLRKWISILKDFFKSYFDILLKEYKSLFLMFDIEYQKQKKAYNNQQKLKADLNRALKLFRYIDHKMEKSGETRQRRRQFWQNFFRSGQVRRDIFDDLLKEIR